MVDNASTDGTAELLETLAGPDLHSLNTGENLGGAGGFARGVEAAVQAGYQALWLMDDDTLPEPGALAALLRCEQDLQGNYGWLSSRAVDRDGADQPMNRQRRTPYRDIAGYGDEPVPSVMASFVSLFLRADTVREFGLPLRNSLSGRMTGSIPGAFPAAAPATRCKKPGGTCHAAQTVVNIAKDTPDRLGRYRYFYLQRCGALPG